MMNSELKDCNKVHPKTRSSTNIMVHVRSMCQLSRFWRPFTWNSFTQ